MGLLLAALTITTHVPAASAAGINLYWNECSLGPTATTNMNFACDTNVGPHILVASFDPPTYLYGSWDMRFVIDLQTAASTLPPWWQFKNAGSCRATSLVGARTEGLGYCDDPWAGVLPQGIEAYYVTANTPGLPLSRARIVASNLTDFIGAELEPGREYYAGELRIYNSRTVGADACSGCLDPVCLVLNMVKVRDFYTHAGWTITAPLTSNYVTWQGGAIGGAGCPGATPTLNRTWGALKSLYR